MNVLCTVIVFFTVLKYLSASECISRDYGKGGTVCVCNDKHCDTYPPIQKVEGNLYLKVTSNKAGLRFEQEEGSFVETDISNADIIEIGNNTFQEIIGFGGAFTDSTGININSLNEDAKNLLIRSYFADEGLEYSLGRVPIAGTDFSIEPYSYCDTDTPDPDLTNFSLRPEDHSNKIPIIQKALELRNKNLNLFASAWIAPNWMRTIPGFTAQGSFIKDEMYQSWANYHLKFLNAYRESNITFWGITTGNEPLTSFLPKEVPSVAWLPTGMIKYIKHNLGPTLRNSMHSDIKILTIDDQRILLPWITDWLFSDEDVQKYVDGIGVHWYEDVLVTPEVLDITHNKYPDKFILSTEACEGYIANDIKIGNWDRGENYANDIIQDLNHWVIGWTDWNMALNVEGGPTFINNFVESPILVNATAGEFYKQPMYYTLGHFSKFVPKGSFRLESTILNDQVPSIAFKRPDNGTAVILLNKKLSEVSLTVRDKTKGDINLKLTPKSITSIVYW